MERAGRSRQGRDKGRKKRTERSRKSLSCWFKLGQGATDLEPKGQSGSSSQTSLVLRQGPRGSTLQHRRVRRQPETLGSGSSGLAPASVSPQHSTQTHGPLPSRSSFPSLGSHGHSQVLWRRPRRPRPEVALTRSLTFAVWSSARDGDAGSGPRAGLLGAGNHRVAVKKRANALPAGLAHGHEAWFLRGPAPAPFASLPGTRRRNDPGPACPAKLQMPAR